MKRLTAAAVVLLQGHNLPDHKNVVLPSTGLSPEDMAQRSLLEVLKYDDDHWVETVTEDVVFRFACHVMRNDFIDSVRRRKEYQQTAVMDVVAKDFEQPSLSNFVAINDGIKKAEAASMLSSLTRMVKGDAELVEQLEAILIGEAETRDDIATLIGCSPKEVSHRRSRLQRALATLKPEKQ